MLCECYPPRWRVPKAGDAGLVCAECESVVPWDWLDENPAVANWLLAAERRRDPEGFVEFCAGVLLAKIEYWDTRGGRPVAARRPRRGKRSARPGGRQSR